MHALRLLKVQQDELQHRYTAIDDARKRLADLVSLPLFFPNAIRVDNSSARYPAICLPWVEGESVVSHVKELCRRGDRFGLKELRSQFLDLCRLMRERKVAHGDLSPDNMILTSEGLRMIDYDSLWFPEISKLRCHVGIGHLQHPRRTNPIGAHADQFAFLMYDAILVLLKERPELIDDPAVSFEQRFVLSRDDVLERRGPISKALWKYARAQATLVEEYARGEYAQFTEGMGATLEENPVNERDMAGRATWPIEQVATRFRISEDAVRGQLKPFGSTHIFSIGGKFVVTDRGVRTLRTRLGRPT
jgi:serine/threonine protein kinase